MTDGFAILIVFFGIVTLAIATVCSKEINSYEKEIILEPGSYQVGDDVPAGKGDLKATAGGGNFIVRSGASKSWTIGNNIGTGSDLQPKRFRNITLNKGDTIEINGNVTVLVEPPAAITDPSEETLCPGIYRFGVDVPPGKYDLETVSGDGDVLLVEFQTDQYVFYQDMSLENPFKAHSFKNIVCTKEFELWINGSLQIKLNPSEKQPKKLKRPY